MVDGLMKRGGFARLIASPPFQKWASRFPLTRGLAKAEGEALFGLVSGFVQSQLLMALVELRVLELLRTGPLPAETLARRCGVPEERMQVLLQGGVALRLLGRRRAGFALARRGAALLGVPGLSEMILHHRVLYRDLQDPAAFFRGETQTELADFWPYVFGQGAAEDPAQARRYSRLMADSQMLVADETLKAVSLRGARHLMDVGGGTGAFLRAVGAAWPDLALTLVDLRAVVADAEVPKGTTVVPVSFRDEPLPPGADAISLVRVLYDHSDATVGELLAKVFDALPPGGRLIVSEPMTGGDRPTVPGDVYFAVYCMAIQTGKARSPQRIGALLKAAGFVGIEVPKVHRPFVTGVVTARKAAVSSRLPQSVYFY